jgi:amino acid transporter
MAVGDTKIIAESQKLGPGLLFVFAEHNVGKWFSDIATVLFVTSLFAALLSFHNAVARYFFSLGRERVLPRVLARVQPRTGAPIAGSIAQSAVALVLIVVFVAGGKDPVLGLFTWLTNVGALGVIFLMALTSVSIVVYLRRNRQLLSEARAFHEVAAALSAAALFVAFYLAITNFDVLLGSKPNDPLNWLLPGLIVLAAAVGLAYGLFLRGQRPEIYAGIGLGGQGAEAHAEQERALAAALRT